LRGSGGVFVVLIAGILVGFIVAFFEFLTNFRNTEKSVRINHGTYKNLHNLNATHVDDTTIDKLYLSPPRSFWVEMFEELRFAIWCTNKRQRPELSASCEDCQIN